MANSTNKFQSSYVPLDIAASVNEHSEGVQGGESCRIDALKNHFAWMRGNINGWYGWANDGKSEFRDFLKIMKAKKRQDIVNGKPVTVDGWKFAMFRPEDMDAINVNGTVKISANRIYKNLAWNLTGKTWNKNFSKKYFVPQMTLDEEMEALEFIENHFFVIYPKDRKYKNIIDEFTFLHETKGIDGFEGDPFSSIIIPDASNEAMLDALYDFKEFSLYTNTVVDFVNHAKVQRDEKTKEGKFKVVTQFMVPYSGAWDAKMDGQFSIYRPERHLNPSDPKVEFYNLKQKNSQIVGVERGFVGGIEFSYTKKQYYFSGVNPLTGEDKNPKKPEHAADDSMKPKQGECPF
jgi:hypothetical protein